MYMTDFAYDGPILLVPLSPSYPSSPVLNTDVPFTDGESTSLHSKPPLTAALEKSGRIRCGRFRISGVFA